MTDEGAGRPATAQRWRWIYAELRRVEIHRTEELQNEQRRIASVLAVNGFLFAFLAAGGLIDRGFETGTWQFRVYVAAVCLLAIGLAFGLLALRPRTPIQGTLQRHAWPEVEAVTDSSLFLNTRWFISGDEGGAAELAEGALFETAPRALAKTIEDSNIVATLARRRRRIRDQIVCIGAALVLVAVALIGAAQ